VCGSEDSGAACDFLDSSSIGPFEGIYQFTNITINTGSCMVEGDSVLSMETEPYFYLAERSGFGILPPSLMLITCADVANCREKLAQQDEFIGPAADRIFSFSCHGGPNQVSSTISNTGFGMDGVCTGGHVDEQLLERAADGSIRIEVRVTPAGDYPQDREGFCSTDASEKATRGNSCNEYQVFSGDFIESL